MKTILAVVLMIVSASAEAWQSVTVRPRINPWTMERSQPTYQRDTFAPDISLERMGNSWDYHGYDDYGRPISGRIRQDMWGGYELDMD